MAPSSVDSNVVNIHNFVELMRNEWGLANSANFYFVT